MSEQPEDAPRDPHELWCVIGVFGEYVLLAAVSPTSIKDDGALVLDPRQVITDAGQRMYVMMGYTVIRHKFEVQPPNHITTPSCTVMSGSWAKLAPDVMRLNPPTEPVVGIDWSAMRFIKCMLWNRWGGGCKGKPEVTARECHDFLIEDEGSLYVPLYDGDFEPERLRLVSVFAKLIGEKGPDYPVRQMLPE